MTGSLKSLTSLRAWKLAVAGPSAFWYFPIFFALLSSKASPNPTGLAALFLVLMISASWGFLLNDLFDREADSKSGRGDAIHGYGLKKSTMWFLILLTGIASWVVVFLIGGGYVFKVVLLIDYLVAILYSTPPIKLKIRKFWGFLANSLMERPLPILVFLCFMGYYNVWTIVLPVLMELSWSVFKHQAADIKEDINANVTTFAVYLGERVSNRIVFSFLNPLSVISLLFLTALTWWGVADLRLLLAICFAVILVGEAGSFALEKAGKITTYITPTDPPYIIFLNLAYRFLLLPALAFGIASLRPEYYLLTVLLGITLAYQLYAYARILSHKAKHSIG